jgi:hypothetical protein
MAAFPELPGELRSNFPNSFWNWWQALRTWLLSGFATQGSIEITTIGKGLILRSPNGSRWQITVDNTGAVISTAL